MTQLRNHRPSSPKQAAHLHTALDSRLDPDWFKAIGDPTRVRLLGCLMKCGRACTVGEIAECCEVDLSVVSRHLRILERAGVLGSTKHGRSVSYAVRYGDICRTLHLIIEAIEECCPQGCHGSGAGPVCGTGCG